MNIKVVFLVFVACAFALLIALLVTIAGFNFVFGTDRIARLENPDEISEYMGKFDLINKTINSKNGVSINRIEHQSDVFSTWVVMKISVNNRSDINKIKMMLANSLRSKGWSKCNIDLIDKQIGDIEIDTTEIRHSVSWEQRIPEGNGSFTKSSIKLFYSKNEMNMLLIYREDGN